MSWSVTASALKPISSQPKYKKAFDKFFKWLGPKVASRFGVKALDRAASASVQVRKERAAHDRWLASKLSTRYADRTEVHLSGSVDMRGTLGGPLIGQAQIIEATPAELPEGDEQG